MWSIYGVPLGKLRMQNNFKCPVVSGAVFSVGFRYFADVEALLSAPLCAPALGLWQSRWTLECKLPER